MTAIVLNAYVGSELGIGGPIIQALGVDFGMQLPSVAYRAAVYRGELPANRATVIFTACTFIGQLVGTSVGNAVHSERGWTGVGTFHLGLSGATLVVCVFYG